jgi:hypothetical protein
VQWIQRLHELAVGLCVRVNTMNVGMIGYTVYFILVDFTRFVERVGTGAFIFTKCPKTMTPDLF